jgi:hypothetical protein
VGFLPGLQMVTFSLCPNIAEEGRGGEEEGKGREGRR